MTKLTLFGMVICLLTPSGCNYEDRCNVESKDGQAAKDLSKNRVAEYFRSIPIGYSVAKIESDLKLPQPYKHEAPAYTSPHWKFKYWCNDVWIYFEAEQVKEGIEASDNYRYVGEWDVCTKKEYYEEIGKTMGSSGSGH